MALLDWLRGDDLSAPTVEFSETPPVTDLNVVFQAWEDYLKGVDTNAIPAIYRARQLVCSLMASLPLKQVTESTGMTDSETPSILRNPDPTITYRRFMFQTVHSFVTNGNVYWMIRYRDKVGNVLSVRTLDPMEVTVAWDSNRLHPVYSWRNQPLEHGTEIVHVPFNDAPGKLTGTGPVEAARTLIQTMGHEQRLALKLARDGGQPSGLIRDTTGGHVSETTAQVYRETWAETYKDGALPAFLGGGLEFQPLTFSPVDLQWHEARRLSNILVATAFGLPAHVLNEATGDSSMYTNITGLLDEFLRLTLNPDYLEPLEDAISAYLLPRGKRARFDTEELLRLDEKGLVEMFMSAVGQPFLTVDEARARLNYAPLIVDADAPITN